MPYFVASLNILLIGGLAWWTCRRMAAGDERLYWTALAARMIAGLLLGVIYFHFYTVGDTIVFFHDAVRLKAIGMSDPGSLIASFLSGTPPIELEIRDPRGFLFTSLLALVNLVTGDNYWVSSLWFSLLSFLGAWYLVRTIDKLMPGLRVPAIIAFLFWPSVVFWSSGIIKESVAFGSLCYLTGIFIALLKNQRHHFLEYCLAALALWLLFGLKYYWAAVFIPSVATCLVVHWFVKGRMANDWRLLVTWLGIFAVFCLAASFTHPNFYLERFLDVIRTNHDEFVAISRPENLIHFPRAVEDWSDVIVNAPWALLSGLFRPALFEPDSMMGHISSVENLVLAVISIAAIVYAFRRKGFDRVLLLTTLTYVFLLCIFLALSTPNFGTLSRYRIGFLPFYVLTILAHHPFLNWFPWPKKQISTFTK